MPLIKPGTHRVRYLRHICRPQEPTRDALVLGARFIGDTPDYVLDEVEATLLEDSKFRARRRRTARRQHPSDALHSSRRTAPCEPSCAYDDRSYKTTRLFSGSSRTNNEQNGNRIEWARCVEQSPAINWQIVEARGL